MFRWLLQSSNPLRTLHGVPNLVAHDAKAKAVTSLCEGGVDVVGVVTSLVRGGAQVVLHGDQVVELSVLLGVHEKGEVEEDGEDQVEAEREEDEVREKRSCVTVNVDEMRLKNTLSHEVHVTQTSRGVTKLRALRAVLTGCATCACRCSCTCC